MGADLSSITDQAEMDFVFSISYVIKYLFIASLQRTWAPVDVLENY